MVLSLLLEVYDESPFPCRSTSDSQANIETLIEHSQGGIVLIVDMLSRFSSIIIVCLESARELAGEPIPSSRLSRTSFYRVLAYGGTLGEANSL